MPTEKNLTLPAIPKELLDVLNDLFPEQTPDLSMENKGNLLQDRSEKRNPIS